MTRKGKAFLIGFLVPMLLALFGVPFVAEALVLVAAGILVGGLAGLIASVRTSGPPMSRKAGAALFGFYSPVVPGCGFVMLAYLKCVLSGPDDWRGFDTSLATWVAGGPSILLGLLIALWLAVATRNEPDPQKCDKCGYSLVGLTSDECPECGHTFSETATAP